MTKLPLSKIFVYIDKSGTGDGGLDVNRDKKKLKDF